MTKTKTPQYLLGQLAEQCAALKRLTNYNHIDLDVMKRRIERIEATRLELEAAMVVYQHVMLEHDLQRSLAEIRAQKVCEEVGSPR